MTETTDLATLSFDIPDMLEAVRPWIETESPTYDRAAVNRMMDLATREFAMAGATVERIPGSQGLGDNVRARFHHAVAGRPAYWCCATWIPCIRWARWRRCLGGWKATAATAPACWT